MVGQCCCVRNCHSRSHDRAGRKLHNGIRFFAFPTWKKHEGQQVEELTCRRRMAWVAAVGRKDITVHRITASMKVCSLHFHTGQPAYEMLDSHPDWSPSLHLGHGEGKAGDKDRFARRIRRHLKQKTAGRDEKEPARPEADVPAKGPEEEAAEREEAENRTGQEVDGGVRQVPSPAGSPGGSGDEERPLSDPRLDKINRLLEENSHLIHELDVNCRRLNEKKKTVLHSIKATGNTEKNQEHQNSYNGKGCKTTLVTFDPKTPRPADKPTPVFQDASGGEPWDHDYAHSRHKQDREPAPRGPRRFPDAAPKTGSSGGSSLRVHAVRLGPGQELLASLRQFVEERRLRAPFILTCVGSVTKATLRLVDEVIELSGQFEILSLVGTLNPDAHLHVCLADVEGKTVGGHVLGGMEVFTTAEVVVGEAAELHFSREPDRRTGFPELVVRTRSAL